MHVRSSSPSTKAGGGDRSTPPLRRAGLDASSRLRALAAARLHETPPRLVDLLAERRQLRSSSSLTLEGGGPAADADASSGVRSPSAEGTQPDHRGPRRLDRAAFTRHMERMGRPNRPNADGYRVNERGQEVAVLHRDERDVLNINTPVVAYGEIADCIDRLYRQSQLQQRAREQQLAAKYLDPPVAHFLLGSGGAGGGGGAFGGGGDERPKSPTGVFTKLTPTSQESMVGRLYTGPAQRQQRANAAHAASLAALKRSKEAYRKLPPPSAELLGRLYHGPREDQTSAQGKLHAKYAPPLKGPTITKRPSTPASPLPSKQRAATPAKAPTSLPPS